MTGQRAPHPRVAFLGGNGHAAARLEPARAALGDLPAAQRFELDDVAYPGFEGRARAATWSEFLDAVAPQVAGADLVMSTGIGGLIALALRAAARGPALPPAPLVIQGGVLWGLEHRAFPRLMKGPAPRLLQRAFAFPPLQRRFARRHFERAPEPATLRAFFAGYRDCAAFPDFFRWFRAPLLRQLERAFASEPERLDGVRCWWGARDTVVGLDELRTTERALGRTLPCRTFDGWGHYPMLDDPAGWVRAVAEELA